jgi:hypothetical protein
MLGTIYWDIDTKNNIPGNKQQFLLVTDVPVPVLFKDNA